MLTPVRCEATNLEHGKVLLLDELDLRLELGEVDLLSVQRLRGQRG